MTRALRRGQVARPMATPAMTPPHAPLIMPDQDFSRPFHDPDSRVLITTGQTRALRVICLVAPLVITLLPGRSALGWFALDGRLSLTEVALVCLSSFAFYWVVHSVVIAVIGLFWRPDLPTAKAQVGGPLNIAILLPMYGEAAAPTIGQAVRLLAGLSLPDARHRYSLHVLSDTRNADPALAISYRRRDENTDFKSGNIRAWVRSMGHLHDAMLVLDADSVMAPATVTALVAAMAADPGCGLIQTIPRVLPGVTLWQQMQSFASEVYGPTLGRGIAMWTGDAGNFLGHNALIRVRAFAAAAGLPHLPGKAPRGGVILSHDFVEAALMRRAGWAVRIMPAARESHEETPETLIGYIRRDRRWCQGNMQHLRLLAMPGLHPLSRFHLLQGAMGYLSSVWWLILLVLWALPAPPAADPMVWTGHALRPVWPALPAVTQAMLAGFVGLMLVAPKLIGILAYLLQDRPGPGPDRVAYVPFVATLLAEMALSVLLAPLLMVHQVRAVLSTFAGSNGGWAPHVNGQASLGVLLRFHAVETVLGAAVLVLLAFGWLTLWILPVGLGLVLAVPLSALVQMRPVAFHLFRPARPVL